MEVSSDPTTAWQPLPPTADEARDYFLGLASQPRLIARTNSTISPWTRPLYRVLGPITDCELVQQWRDNSDIVNDKIIDALQARNMKWTTFVPLVVHGIPYEDISRAWIEDPGQEGNPEAEHTLFLIIGVAAATCSWAVGYAAANDCRRILREQFSGYDIHALVTEIAVMPSPSPSPSSLPVSPASPTHPTSQQRAGPQHRQPLAAPGTSSNAGHDNHDDHASHTNHALFRAFDSTFDERVTVHHQSMYKYFAYAEMQAVNTAVARFLPLPGQVIQQAFEKDVRKRNEGSGTLCLYLRLKGKDGNLRNGLFALTSRHVVMKDGMKDDNTPSDIPVAWGSDEAIREQHKFLGMHANIIILRRQQEYYDKGMLDSEGEKHFHVAERCVSTYIPKMMGLLEREFADVDDIQGENQGARGKGARGTGRVFGHVELSSRNEMPTTKGYLRDWALVAVHGVGTDKTISTTVESDILSSPPQRPPFFTNHAYIGWNSKGANASVSMLDVESEVERQDAFDVLMNTARDRTSFVKLAPPPPSDYVSSESNENSHSLDPQFVFKTGGCTDSIMGVASPIEAVVRISLSGRDENNGRDKDQIIAAGVLPVLGIPPRKPSMDGKRAIVSSQRFSCKGDAGSAVFDRTGTVVAMLNAGVRADKEPDEFHEPPSYSLSYGNRPLFDITYATPMTAVFDDIRETTGLDLVML